MMSRIARARDVLAAAPWGLVGMVVLVAAVERAVSARWLDVAPVEAAHYRFARHAADHEARGSAVLCFGDSQLKEGILPAVIEARTGLRAYNLAVQASPAPFSYFLFRRCLRAGVRPSAVVVDFNAPLLKLDPTDKRRELAILAGPRDCLELAWDARRPDLVLHWALARLSPTFQNRDQLRETIRSALAGRDGSLKGKILAALRNWRVNRGTFVLPKNPAVTRLPAFPGEDVVLNAGWSCHPTNRTYLRKFFAAAAAKKILVYVVIPPFTPRINRRREELGLEARYDATVLAEALRWPGVTVLDGRALEIDPRHFADGFHLDRDGAFVFSHVVADHLAPVPPLARTSRLVRLSTPGSLPPAPPLEDSVQSETALYSAAPLKR